MDEWRRLKLRKTPVNILQRQACCTEVTGVHALLASQLFQSFAQFQTSVFVSEFRSVLGVMTRFVKVRQQLNDDVVVEESIP